MLANKQKTFSKLGIKETSLCGKGYQQKTAKLIFNVESLNEFFLRL